MGWMYFWPRAEFYFLLVIEKKKGTLWGYLFEIILFVTVFKIEYFIRFKKPTDFFFFFLSLTFYTILYNDLTHSHKPDTTFLN